MNEYIAEEQDYIYEMMYINTLNIESDLPFNELSVYSNFYSIK